MGGKPKTARQKAAAKAWRTIRRGPSKTQAKWLGWLAIAGNWLRVEESRFVRRSGPYWTHASVYGIICGISCVPRVTVRVLKRNKWVGRKTEPEYCGGSKNADGTTETVSTWTRWEITPKGRRALQRARAACTV